MTTDASLRPPSLLRRRWLRNLILFLFGISLSFGLCLSLSCRPYRMGSQGMRPTVEPGDRVLALSFGYGKSGVPRRGELILFRSFAGSDPPGTLSLKRVVGIPGDVVEVKRGSLWRNGRLVDEPYIREPMAFTWGPVTCPQGHVVVLGDNRNESQDSHTWTVPGPGGTMRPSPFVPLSSIEGRAAMIVFPPWRMRVLRRS